MAEQKLKKRFLRVLCLIIAIIISTPFALYISAETPDIVHAEAACIYNIDSGTLVYEKNPDKILYPASTVKMMTALLAIEYYKDNMSQVITADAQSLKNIIGNNIGIKSGEKMTAEQLISALIVGGANDAANILAVNISGTIDDFVLKMNERAKELGAKNTYYTNPSGIHNDAMFTTLSDTLLIALSTYRNSTFMEITALAKYVLPATNMSTARTIYSRNAFQTTYFSRNYYYSAVSGMNAGATSNAGYCVVASAKCEENGLSYIAIVMGADSDDNEIYSYSEARKLFDWAFPGFSYITVLESSKIMCEIPVTLSSKTDHTILTPENDVELFLPVDIDLEKDIKFEYHLTENTLSAPVSAGQITGKVNILYNGETVASVNLITKTGIERSRSQEMMNQLFSVVSSVWFLPALIAIIFIGIVFVIAKSMYRYRKKRAIAIKTHREQNK